MPDPVDDLASEIDVDNAARLHFLEALVGVASDVASRAKPADVVAAIGRGASAIGDVTGVSVGVSLTPDSPLHLAAVTGINEDIVRRWAEIPRDAPVPLTESLRTGESLHFPTRDDMLGRYPHLAPELEQTGHQAWAVIPLKVESEIYGVIGLTWTENRRLDHREELFLSALGRLGGDALVRSVRDVERRDLLVRLAETVEEERAAVAADLHDDTVQRLAGVHMRLGSLGSGEDLSETIAHCQNELTIVIKSLRDLVFTLHPPVIDQTTLGETIREFVGWRFGDERGRVMIRDRLEEPLDPAVALIAYRIAQEGLTNAHKHAGPADVEVVLRLRGTDLVMRIVDRGRGADPAAVLATGGGHVGFRTMRERAESIGGTLEWSTEPGAGFVVEAVLPAVG